MQAEHIPPRGNGFIISPKNAAPLPVKGPISTLYNPTEKITALREGICAVGAECCSYAQKSAQRSLKKLLSVCVAVCCILVFFGMFTFATGIYCNGEKIAVCHSEKEFFTALTAADSIADSSGISTLGIRFRAAPVLSLRFNVMNVSSLRDKMLLCSPYFSEGCTLYSGNTAVFNAESTQTAQQVVNEYISSFTPNGKGSLKTELSYKTSIMPSGQISSKEECAQLLSESDSILVVSVVSSYTSKELPFETETKNDESLYIGETVTVSEGKSGTAQISQETIYENGTEKSSRIISENIIAEPVKRIVRVGTKPKEVLKSGLFYPLNGVLSSPFGSRWGKTHEGIDIAVAEGTPVKAAECGTVCYVSENAGGYGKFIRIDHGYGVKTAYAHLSEIQVILGQTVSAGSVIALSGNTGRSTGPHLHFEITNNDEPIDPIPYLKK